MEMVVTLDYAEILLSEFLKKDPFSWGRENLVSRRSMRNYIAALKAADENNFELLAAFVRS